MLKKLFILIFVVSSIFFESYAHAGIKKKKKSSGKEANSRIVKNRKHKKRKHHGNGPDLKKITSDENFKAFDERPMNGVNSIENDSKQ